MTDKPTRTRNTTGPLDEFAAAKRIAALIGGTSARLHDVEQSVRNALANERRETQIAIGRLVERVPVEARPRIAKLVIAAGLELCGFELAAGNDAIIDDPDASNAASAPDPLPPVAQPLTPERLAIAGKAGRR